MSASEKLNLLLIKSIFSTGERLIQTKLYYKLFYCLKRNVSQTLKSGSCKKFIPKYVYRRGYSVSKRLVKLIMFQDFPSQLSGYQHPPPLSFVLSYLL